MCHAKLMARGVRAIRFCGKEKKEEWEVRRDEVEVIKKKKAARLREAMKEKNQKARVARKLAKLVRLGEKILRKRHKR